MKEGKKERERESWEMKVRYERWKKVRKIKIGYSERNEEGSKRNKMK